MGVWGSEKIEQFLLVQRLITPNQLAQALETQRRTFEPLTEVLVRMGAISEEALVRALAARAGVAPWNLLSDAPEPGIVSLLPISVCREYQMLPVQARGDLLLLAMRNPHDLLAIECARQESGMRIEPVLADENRLRKAIDHYAHGSTDGRTVVDLVARAMLEVRERTADAPDSVDSLTEVDTRPVVGLVNQILTDAIRMKASDVHVEPRAQGVEVRYRLDGQLRRVQEFPSELLPMVVARVKIMAELDIVEFRMPQDGRISARLDGRDIDMRVSVLPNHYGPRVVLRLLDRTAALRPLEQLGFSEQNLGLFQQLIAKPYGMILVTGPTGSGKTTSLYAGLQAIHREGINIMTCEDPIEYDVPGVNQSQVNEKVGLTFATQLRAILRQDPDVVLVGEIRDQETAEVAIRASLTGHLVLSTLHTNDAPSAVPRLVDIGVKPYLIGTSLIGVMAQRLVRCLCPDCKREEEASPKEAAIMHALSNHTGPFRVWRPVGCDACFGTGYRGRAAVSELLPVTSSMQRMIATGAPSESLREEGLQHGFVPMQVDAIQRVLSGQTSFEEASRTVFLEDALISTPLLRVA